MSAIKIETICTRLYGYFLLNNFRYNRLCINRFTNNFIFLSHSCLFLCYCRFLCDACFFFGNFFGNSFFFD